MRSHYPKASPRPRALRPTGDAAGQHRSTLLQSWPWPGQALSASGMEDLFYEAELVLRFAGLTLSEPIPANIQELQARKAKVNQCH